ncbi:MAG: hypothetical protein WD595_07010 [Waddliaceae bacterium]
MFHQIKRISVHQTAKVFALIYLFIGAIFSIPAALMSLYTGDFDRALMFFILPFFYLFLGYLLFAVFALIYNMIASNVGGIEFEIGEGKEL